MKTITLARKPLVGTVAKNVLTHGCGGLNIDASRIGTGEDRTAGGMSGSKPSLYEDGFHHERRERPVGGRFPANLILQHLDGCRCEGVKTVVNPSGRASGPTKDALEMVCDMEPPTESVGRFLFMGETRP